MGVRGAGLNPAVESVSAFFPCYNDEATIAWVVRRCLDAIDRLGVRGEVLVVDDGSTDSSRSVVTRLAEDDERVRLVSHGSNRGYGGALRTGFAEAAHQWVFYTDGDGQFDPAELAQLVDAAGDDVDVVQGYKIRRADNVARRFIGRLYHHLVAFAFGLRIRDVDCDFRLVRRAVVEHVELTYDSGVICVELVRKLQDAGARFVEIPVHHHARRHGRSQFFRPGNILRSIRDLMELWTTHVLRRGRSINGTPRG